MVKIRLVWGGAKKRPFFTVVATDSHNRRDGSFIERLGFYNPKASAGEEGLRLSLDRIQYWQGVGAQLSPTVKRLISDFGKKLTQPAAPAQGSGQAAKSASAKSTASAKTPESAPENLANADASTDVAASAGAA